MRYLSDENKIKLDKDKIQRRRGGLYNLQSLTNKNPQMYKSKLKLARGPSSKVGQVQIVGILEGAASQSP